MKLLIHPLTVAVVLTSKKFNNDLYYHLLNYIKPIL